MNIEWDSPFQKEEEWSIAKNKLSPQGILLPSGTKLRRKDSNLSHSFIIVGNKLLAMAGKGVYLGKGKSAHVKIAEDEIGHLYALKIRKESNIEKDILSDLGIGAGHDCRRYQTPIRHKYYILSDYLGTTLLSYLKKKQSTLTDDERYELAIKIALLIHNLHSGRHSKTGTKYIHGDIHTQNITIDEEGNLHLIDFERAHSIGHNVFNSFIHSFYHMDAIQKDLRFVACILSKNLQNPIFLPRMIEQTNLNKLLGVITVPFELQSSLLDFTKKLTFIRFNLDTYPLYEQAQTDAELDEMITNLNAMSHEILMAYSAFRTLKIRVTNTDLRSCELVTQVNNLEDTFKHYLIAQIQNDNKDIELFSKTFQSILESIGYDTSTSEHLIQLQLIMQKIDEIMVSNQNEAPSNWYDPLW